MFYDFSSQSIHTQTVSDTGHEMFQLGLGYFQGMMRTIGDGGSFPTCVLHSAPVVVRQVYIQNGVMEYICTLIEIVMWMSSCGRVYFYAREMHGYDALIVSYEFSLKIPFNFTFYDDHIQCQRMVIYQLNPNPSAAMGRLHIIIQTQHYILHKFTCKSRQTRIDRFFVLQLLCRAFCSTNVLLFLIQHTITLENTNAISSHYMNMCFQCLQYQFSVNINIG